MKTIVIVEGSSDTNKLRTIWPDIVTVETSGHGLSQKIINLIVLLSKTHKMIVFTDPDKPGLDIRKKINEILSNNCFNVFLPQRPLNHKGKWGVAEAPAKEIMAAFKEQKKIFLS
ncbi:toprim domain-containing protein [Spiroplasma endosymbiont of Anurida maritima]|uniref:toprim domain-containing protein n=1 Tax=Spiroplasma endosymbiont of Anurida maritima TaxID=2967972 RepID=UPI0036D33FA3